MKRSLPLILVATASALALTACGSSSQVAQGGDKPSASAAVVSGAEAAVTAAQAELDKYTGKPTFKAPNEAFDAKSLAGKTVAIVAVDQTTPALKATVESAREAAKVVGIKTTFYDAKDTPSEMVAGVAQAISQKVDGIILAGVSTTLISKQLTEAKAAGIPVVAANNNGIDVNAPGQGAGEGIYATAAPDYELQGKIAADAAIVRTGGNVKALLVTTDGIDPAPAVTKGFQEGLAACSTCSVLDTRHVELGDWFNGNLASLTSSLVKAHEDANIVLPIYATMALIMVPAADQAGAKNLTFFTTSGGPDTLKQLAGTATLGGVAGQSDSEMGWLAINQVMRGVLGLKPGYPAVPTRYVTADTVKADGNTYDAMYGDTYKDEYKKLWGLS